MIVYVDGGCTFVCLGTLHQFITQDSSVCTKDEWLKLLTMLIADNTPAIQHDQNETPEAQVCR